MLATKGKTLRPFTGKEVFLWFLIQFLTQSMFNLKEMVKYFIFYKNLAVAQKTTTKTTTSICISIEWLKNALFCQEITVGLRLGL